MAVFLFGTILDVLRELFLFLGNGNNHCFYYSAKNDIQGQMVFIVPFCFRSRIHSVYVIFLSYKSKISILWWNCRFVFRGICIIAALTSEKVKSLSQLYNAYMHANVISPLDNLSGGHENRYLFSLKLSNFINETWQFFLRFREYRRQSNTFL